MSPRFSIVVTNYQYEAYVGEAIASALAQTWPEVEVIVVDDGSKDGSRAVIEGFSGIRAIFQENAGHVACAARGLAAATGDVVIFLDADDVLAPEACARIAAHWRDDLHALQFRLAVFGEGVPPGRTLPDYPFQRGDTRAYFEATGSFTYTPTSGNAYARGFAERVFAGSQGLVSSAFDMWLDFAAALTGRIVSIDDVLGGYRVHGANMSQPGGRRSMIAVLRDVFYAYHAQQSAHAVAAGYGIATRRPAHLVGAYYLKWYMLLRGGRPTRWDIPPVPVLAGLVAGWRSFLALETVGVKTKAINVVELVLFALAPRHLRRLVAERLYGWADDIGL